MVLIGNLPTADGTPATVGSGSLSVVDSFGNFLGNIGTVPATVDGPWSMTVDDLGSGGRGIAHAFVSNVLSGTISRFDLTYSTLGLSALVTTLATGFNHRLDPAALCLGPSGMAYDAVHNVLLVASSADNSVYEIPNAATANTTQSATLLFTDYTHLHGPLDIGFLPNGHLVVANSDGSNVDPNQPSEIVEFTATGAFVNQMPIDPNNGGAFGLAILNMGWGTFQFAAVDDNAVTLRVWTSVIQ
jgi:DNA-binding beta-propeller fold protein YncE